MKPMSFLRIMSVGIMAAGVVLVTTRQAKSIPSYSRQTGLSCSTCHTVFPHLTPFGRDFELHGYTTNNTQLISDHQSTNDTTSQGRTILEFPNIPMVSARISSRWNDQSGGNGGRVPRGVVTAGQGFISSPDGYGSQDALDMLAGSSIYISGEISPHLGSFIEFSGPDDEGGTVSLGMFDVALVSSDISVAGQNFVYGIRACDAMGAGDPSNTVGTWGLTASLMGLSTHNTLFDPGTAFLEGGMLFGMLGDFDSGGLYASVGAYRPSPSQSAGGYVQGAIAGSGAFDGVNGVNTYVRLSYYLPPIGKNTYSEIGGFSYFGNLNMSAPPSAALAAPGYADKYYDLGLDLQVQYIGDNNLVELFALLQDQRDGAFYGIDGFTGLPGNGSAVSRQGFGLKADYYYLSMIGAYAKYLYQTSNEIKDMSVNGVVLGVSCFPWENVNLRLERSFFATYNIGAAQYGDYALPGGPSPNSIAASDFDVTAVKLEYLF
ncbi:MAG TPA: hypothetical protein PL001_06380 [Candidatus Kryptobacter bacterium]|nr:hypothetical protein [Candidatus Kryptobacter bacterium]